VTYLTKTMVLFDLMQRKKVLLFNPSSSSGEKVIKDQYCSFTSKAGYYWIPIDLLILSGDLASEFEVKVIDSIIEKNSHVETCSRVLEYSPDHIIVLSSILTHESDRALIKELRSHITFKTTFLGDVFYFSPKEMIKFEEVDSIIYEYPCPELVSYIKTGSATCNIAYKENGRAVFSPVRKVTDVAYNTPLHHLFDLKAYSVPFMKDALCTSVLTNFGCKYTCNYCPADSVSFRERSISDIKDELDYLKGKDIRNLWIRDFTFGLNKQRTTEFLTLMKTYDFQWFCLTRSEILEEVLLKSMSDSGCYLVMLGLDTTNNEVMKTIGRRQNTVDVKEKIALSHKLGIQVMLHMILGFPGESYLSMIRTVHFITRTKADFLSVNFFSPRAGSSYFKQESIYGNSSKKLDSNYAEDPELFIRSLMLNLIKYYALIFFYFHPLRIISILSKVKSKKQFYTILKTGLKMFSPLGSK
jgi:anaerobic magnesium-protoporphyrin IX monomethyl ester cyclase